MRFLQNSNASNAVYVKVIIKLFMKTVSLNKIEIVLVAI